MIATGFSVGNFLGFFYVEKKRLLNEDWKTYNE